MKKISQYSILSKHRAALMGLAIICIIVFHYTEDCVNNAYNLNFFVVNYKSYIGSCGVDIFLFLSGFGLYYSFKRNSDIKLFYQKRVYKILIPYFCVAIIAWFVRDIILFDLGWVQLIKDVFFISFFESGSIWFWYILFILVCYFVLPYIFKYIDSENSMINMLNLSVFITVIALLLDVYCNDFMDKVNIALLRFPPFFIGCAIGKASYEEKKFTAATYFAMILSVFLLFLKQGSGIILTRYILGFFGISLIILAAIILEALNNAIGKTRIYKGFNKALEWFGNHSLELYLTHVALRGIMNWTGFPTHRLRYELVMVVLSIVVSFLLKKLTNAITKKIAVR